MNKTGLMIVLSSPSGAGKSTLSTRLLAKDPNMVFSVSATTRAPRDGEVDGKHYFFKSHEAFQSMIKNGEMLEYAEVFGNYYGTPKAPVLEAIQSGRDLIFDVDWQGGQQIQNSELGRHVVSVFILPPSIEQLETRLRTRGQDDDLVIKRRMSEAKAEISHWKEYDYVLVNDDIDQAEKKIEAILAAERVKRFRQLDLVQFVDDLNTEFEERNSDLLI